MFDHHNTEYKQEKKKHSTVSMMEAESLKTYVEFFITNFVLMLVSDCCSRVTTGQTHCTHTDTVQ